MNEWINKNALNGKINSSQPAHSLTINSNLTNCKNKWGPEIRKGLNAKSAFCKKPFWSFQHNVETFVLIEPKRCDVLLFAHIILSLDKPIDFVWI